MKQGFELKKKATKKIQVMVHYGKQKEVVALQEDEGLIEARKYYNTMKKYHNANLEVALD